MFLNVRAIYINLADKLVNFTQGGSSDKAVDTIKLLSWQFNLWETLSVLLLCCVTHDIVLNDLFTNYFRTKNKTSLVLPNLT